MKYFFTLAIFCLALPALAQQRPQHTQYFQNNFLLNPAVAGIESFADVRFGYRNQWTGMEGAPVTFYASAQTSIGKNDRNIVPTRGQKSYFKSTKQSANRNNRFHVQPHHGIGAVAQMGRAGLLTTASMNVSYAYHLPITRTLNLSSGITTGMVQYRLNRNGVRVQTDDDPFIYGDFGNLNKLDLGIGMWLYSRDFYVGLSAIQLLKSKNDVNINDGPKASLQPHFYATGAYRFLFSDMVAFTPSVMIKMADQGTTAADVNAKLIYGQRFWAGLSYRPRMPPPPWPAFTSRP